MIDRILNKVHWSFWPIAIVTLIWNALGCGHFIFQMIMGADTLASLSEAQRAIVENRPVWANAGFALAVFAGAIGGILLLFKRSSSVYFFILSLIGILITMIPVAGLMASGVPFTTAEIVTYVIATPLLGVFLIWYASYAKRKGWLR